MGVWHFIFLHARRVCFTGEKDVNLWGNRHEAFAQAASKWRGARLLVIVHLHRWTSAAGALLLMPAKCCGGPQRRWHHGACDWLGRHHLSVLAFTREGVEKAASLAACVTVCFTCQCVQQKKKANSQHQFTAPFLKPLPFNRLRCRSQNLSLSLVLRILW